MKIAYMRRKVIMLITTIGLMSLTSCSPDHCPTFDFIGMEELIGIILS